MDSEEIKKINFGADYYPEHWPRERWEEDAKFMEELGLKVVRLAEFSWHKMEPEHTKYDFSWLDDAIGIMSKHGISVILGTPTAAPPAWLINKYPEILPVDSKGIKHGFGGRHHDCQSNEIYRKHCAEIVTAMCRHYANNPAVIGWQIDNELGNSHDDFCHCASCRRAFQKWLFNKYSTVENLNRAWGTAFWSQEYNSFDEVFTPRITATGENPSQMVDWRLFHSDLILDFATAQAKIIRSICPKHFITHNCMEFADTVDYYKLGELLDFACQDQYPLGYWFEGGKSPEYRAAACVDVVRSFKKQPIWIMEQESGITGWGQMGRLPKPGQLSEMALQTVAHGADAVIFFRWRSCAMGTEQYWHGILPHSGIPGRTFYELKETINRVSPLMDDMKGAMPDNSVALVYSYKQNYAFRTQPHNQKLNYYGQLLKYYEGLYRKNVSVDFVKDTDDFSKYKLLIAPLQYIVSDELADKYNAYVAFGGTLVLTMRAGVKDENNLCHTDSPLPCNLGNVAGVKINEYDCLINDGVKIDFNGTMTDADVWADLITPNPGTETLATYATEFYAGTAAVTVHKYGDGTCIYVGTEPGSELMDLILSYALEKAGVELKYKSSEGVEITSRTKDGKEYIFAVNTADTDGTYEGIEGEMLLGETRGSLKPFEVQIFCKQGTL